MNRVQGAAALPDNTKAADTLGKGARGLGFCRGQVFRPIRTRT